METDEATLTGESLPVNKHTKPIHHDGLEAQDQLNMGFMGTIVSRGSGLGIVVGTGMDTVIDRKSTRLNSSHVAISYAVFCLKKKTHVNMNIKALVSDY